MGGSIPSPPPAPRERRASRVVLGAVVGLVLISAPVAYLAVDDGGSSSSEQSRRRVETPEALDRVRAAVGQTAAAGSYEMDTETTTSAPGSTSCVSLPEVSTPGEVSASGRCVAAPSRSYTFHSHSVVNLEPYAMVSDSDTPFGFITLHVNSERAWQRNGLNVGYVGDRAPGVPLPRYADAVLGTLGEGPGALAMISIGSRGGHLNLEEEAIAAAEPAGTGTVAGVAVTYYDVTIDVTELVDVPGLSDAQRSTIADALPILERSGYRGTTERIGVDDAGFVREVSATTTMGDGSTTTRHSVLYNFGCAPRVTMPDEPPGDGAPLGPCLPLPTTTTTTVTSAASTATTGVPTTTTVAATTVPTSVPTSDPGATSPPASSTPASVGG